jgi:hypothetical protein
MELTEGACFRQFSQGRYLAAIQNLVFVTGVPCKRGRVVPGSRLFPCIGLLRSRHLVD